MFLRTLRQRGKVIANLHRSITQRVDLKTTTLNLGNDVCFPSQPAHNLDTFARNDKRHQLVIDRGVLNQRALGAQRCLQFANRKEVVSGLITFRTAMLKLSIDLEQLALAFEQLAFEFGVSLPHLHRAANRTMHLVVEIIQLLTQLRHLPVKMSLKIIACLSSKCDDFEAHLYA